MENLAQGEFCSITYHLTFSYRPSSVSRQQMHSSTMFLFSFPETERKTDEKPVGGCSAITGEFRDATTGQSGDKVA